MKQKGHIAKLSKCDKGCFISPIVITRKKDGSIKLALDSKLLNDQIFRNKNQMPNIHELIDNIAHQLSNINSGEVWFMVQQFRLKNCIQSITIVHWHEQIMQFQHLRGQNHQKI